MILKFKQFICLAILTIGSENIFAQKSLFIVTSDTGFVAETIDSTVLVKANINFNTDSLKAADNDAFRIFLPAQGAPGRVPVKIIKTRQSQTTRLNSFNWFGKIEGQPGSFVLITSVDKAVSGYIRDQTNKIYRIQYRGNNVHQIALISNFYFQPDLALRSEAVTSYADTSAVISTTVCCNDTRRSIDVMVLYTPRANELASADAGMNSAIGLCIELSNQSYLNSQINQQLNLVYSGEIDYAETGNENARTFLNQIVLPSDNVLDNIHSLRETYKADIVVLIMGDLRVYTGVANVMDNRSVSFEDSAFCIVKYRDAFSKLVFTHEIGHIMGAGHDCGNGNGLYSNSHGYFGSDFNTIMSTNNDLFRSRIEYFSNPIVLSPTSSSERTGTNNGDCQSNNAATLNNTADIVAEFRCSNPCVHSCFWCFPWWLWAILILAFLLGLFFLIFYFFRRRT